MTAQGGILLVACYELGHPPHGVSLPAAFLERAGYHPAIVDLSVEPLDEAMARRARFVCIAVPMHTALRVGVSAARRIRALNPACHVCFYGLYAQLNRAYLLGGIADSVLSGEAEGALVDLVRGVAAPEKPLLERLHFPTPARGGLPPLSRYARLVRHGSEQLAGYVEASRGCLHRCRHCPIPPIYGGRFFVVSVDVVLADVGQQVAAGARHITFGDPDFLNGPEHARRIVRAIHEAFPELTFDMTAKIEHIVRHGRSFFAELASRGLLFVVSAVESLSDRVLAILDKGHTRADIDSALDILGSVEITMRPSFVPFTPWETLDGYLEILDWVAARNLVEQVDAVQYAIRLLVPPGSLLLEHLEMRPHLGPLVREDFAYLWTHPDPRMERLGADVSALVEQATAAMANPYDTFARVSALARAAAGRTVSAPSPSRRSEPPPRLTEPWFC